MTCESVQTAFAMRARSVECYDDYRSWLSIKLYKIRLNWDLYILRPPSRRHHLLLRDEDVAKLRRCLADAAASRHRDTASSDREGRQENSAASRAVSRSALCSAVAPAVSSE